MTTGTLIPMDRELLLEAYVALPAHVRAHADPAAIEDRLVESICKMAIDTGRMEQVAYA